MKPARIALVQQSFWKVIPIAPDTAAMFYERLFALDPTTRALFADTDMADQGRKLMETLGVVLIGLTKPDTVIPSARALARRHVGYGVLAAQYASVGAALIWTLRQTLGPSFTPDVEEAWAEAYDLIAQVMVEETAAAP